MTQSILISNVPFKSLLILFGSFFELRTLTLDDVARTPNSNVHIKHRSQYCNWKSMVIPVNSKRIKTQTNTLTISWEIFAPKYLKR